MGEVSSYLVAQNSYVRLPIGDSQKNYHYRVCKCGHHGMLSKCHDMERVDMASCLLGSGRIHGNSYIYLFMINIKIITYTNWYQDSNLFTEANQSTRIKELHVIIAWRTSVDFFFSYSGHDTDFYLGCKWCKCFAGETICYETSCVDQYATAEVKSQFTGAKPVNYEILHD